MLTKHNFANWKRFSKFGSDLDAATQSVLDKGRRNVEILKQAQYTPFRVEHQIAILYCGTEGLLQRVPENKVKQFETEFLEILELKHKDVLQSLASGKIDSAITDVLTSVAKDIASKF